MGTIGAHLADGTSARLTPTIRQLLAIFVAVGPEGATSEQFAEELWGDRLPDKWRPALRMSVTRLRKAMGSESFAQAGGRYKLDIPIGDVDVWWLESVAGDGGRTVTEDDVKRALAGVPFASVDARAVVARSAEMARAHQLELINRFCLAAETMSASVAELIRTTDHLDEGTALAIARALASSGYHGRAVSYAEAALEMFEKELGFRSPQLTGLLDELAAGEARIDSSAVHSPVELRRPQPAASKMPAALDHLLDYECHGREAEIEQLCSLRSNLLVGSSGSGKTRLLAHVAAQAIERGDAVSYVGATPLDTPYGPFVAAFGELRQFLVADVVGSPGEVDRDEVHRAAEATRWVATLEHLEKVAEGRTHWVLIDDVQDFDSASKRLVSYLARSQSEQSLVFVLSGRSDQAGDEWMRMRSELLSLGFGEVNVASLSPEAIGELIKNVLPNTSLQARSALAQELIARNAGLPAVARSLLDAVDPETMTLDERIDRYDPQRWTQPTGDLEPGVVAVAVAAAVIGVSFSIGEVIELLDLTEDEVTSALEILWETKRVVDGAEPDQLQFSHALVRDAFLRAAPRFKLAALHRRASEITEDIHARARHQAAAVPDVDAEVAAASLVASAHSYMAASGSWRDALGRLRDADLLLDGGLDADSLILMAQALDYSGMGGKAPRKRAFELAAADGNWDLALHAALSGLPAAEKPDGDPDRIEMLVEIPPEGLTPEARFRLSEALTRLYALDGSPEPAGRWAAETDRLAHTPSQRGRARIARWSTVHHVTAGGLVFGDATFGAADSAQRVRMLQMSAITSIEVGDYDGGLEAHREFIRLAIELGDPLRIWQGKVFDAMVAFDQGQWQLSARLVNEAIDYGTANGMPLALLCGRGQDFHALWVQRTHGELLAGVHLETTDYRTSSIAGASQALVLAAAGQSAQAWQLAKPMVRVALERPRSPAIVVLAMLAEVVAESGDLELINQVRGRLLEFSDCNLVAGYGLANSGPVWRYLAYLATDHGQRLEWLENAVSMADRSGALAWRVVTRLELSRSSDDSEERLVAEALAADTDLEVLLQPAVI